MNMRFSTYLSKNLYEIAFVTKKKNATKNRPNNVRYFTKIDTTGWEIGTKKCGPAIRYNLDLDSKF